MNRFYADTMRPNSLSRASVFPLPFLPLQRTRKKYRQKLLPGWNSSSVKLKFNCSCVTAINDSNSGRTNGGGDTRGDCEDCVEVIVVGSRKDALQDFCFGSPILSPVLRFWNILGSGSEKARLQQRFTSQDSTPRTLDDLSAWQTSLKAVILVVSAAYGSDHITALEVLSNVKSGNGFVVGIILKPFGFEGQRRQDEVKDLVDKLQKQTNFCIVLDTDTLLENDLVTLDEALRTSNNAVLMAMNAISILVSEKRIKLLSSRDNLTREVKFPEFKEIFESYNEARLGYGSGYNVKTSLLRSINDCTFLGIDIKGIDGVILCIIASSGVVDCSEAKNVLSTIRAITKCQGEIAVSIVHDPNLEPNTIVATVIVFGYTKQQSAPRNGIFSSLGQHFLNIFKKKNQQTKTSEKTFLSKSSHDSDVINPPVISDMANTNSLNGTTEDTGVFSDNIQEISGDTDEEFSSLSDESSSGESEVQLFGTNSDSSSYEFNTEGTAVFKRELLTRGNFGQAHSTEFSNFGTNFSDATALVDSVSIYKLPVGVKYPEKFEETPLISSNKHGAGWRIDEKEKKGNNAGLSDVDFNNIVSSFNKGNQTSNSKKQGVLSSRAASMLESERDSEKKWNRVVEMKYRGGIYKGRAQGGLPEGKGRLLLGDGSIYEGMWRYGKRSGLGTFYFNNGDVYQGSWRDDVMHGKGWIYFHTGDRWFVNFWKGKANGEGRFYSKLGDVFFGHFKEGWRHGQFLRINVDGTRSEELWDEGLLVSEKQLEPDAELG